MRKSDVKAMLAAGHRVTCDEVRETVQRESVAEEEVKAMVEKKDAAAQVVTGGVLGLIVSTVSNMVTGWLGW